jgi:Ca2+-binding RTX toxin-like protein
MANLFFFQSDQTVNGTNSDDSMVGNQGSGNVNDLVYGHQGNDTITFDNSASHSTIFGGQGDDSISVFNGGQNQIYGNRGNDVINSDNDTGDRLFGGMGDDTINVSDNNASAVYGNQGNDVIYGAGNQFTKLFGGQGNDKIQDDTGSNLDAIYGNQGNDLLFGGDETVTNSHLYGGQGDDTLVWSGNDGGNTTNDVMTGGAGNDLFVATNGSGGDPLFVNDIVTVTDFLQGSDHLSFTNNTNPIGLVKIDGSGDNAAQALEAANDAFAANGGNREYVFVYGGVGAGYLFYNGDSNSSTAAQAGMALTGSTAKGSVNSTDIVLFPKGGFSFG